MTFQLLLFFFFYFCAELPFFAVASFAMSFFLCVCVFALFFFLFLLEVGLRVMLKKCALHLQLSCSFPSFPSFSYLYARFSPFFAQLALLSAALLIYLYTTVFM